MPYVITNDCINCSACEIECLEKAILSPSIDSSKIKMKRTYKPAVHYFIDQRKCNGCILFDYPRCIEICPMDAIK